MLYREIIAVRSQIRTKHINTLCGQNVELYRMSQKERSIFWEAIVSVILSKNVYMNMCHIPNGSRDRAISMYNR